MKDYIIPFESLGMDDVARVGGKNASLGEMIAGLGSAGVRVPGGFATTADAYRDFLAQDGLDKRIREQLDALDTNNTDQLAEVGKKIRGWVMEAELPARLPEDWDHLPRSRPTGFSR